MVGEVGLGTLPYDLLLNIAFYLDLYDIHALHLVSLLMPTHISISAFSVRHLGPCTMPQPPALYTAN